jgi:hypothetical protein
MINLDLKVDITESEVVKLYGYESLEEVNSNIRKVIREMIEIGVELADFKATSYQIEDVEIKEDESIIILNNNYELYSSYLVDKLGGSAMITVGLVTIASKLEEKISELFKENEYLKANVLDLVGNRLLDRITKEVWHIVRNNSLTMDMGVSGYYSPSGISFSKSNLTRSFINDSS